MTIDVTQETERIVREELQSGHFRSVDDLILKGVRAWREIEQREASQDRSGAGSSGEERLLAVERIRELRWGVRMDRSNASGDIAATVTLREFAHLGHRY